MLPRRRRQADEELVRVLITHTDGGIAVACMGIAFNNNLSVCEFVCLFVRALSS